MGLRGPRLNPSPFRKTFQVPDNPKGKTRADRLINWLKSLPVTSGMFAGKLIEIPTWQESYIRPIYRTDKKNKRIVRQALITMPRKNGKTQIAAMLGLAHLCGPMAETSWTSLFRGCRSQTGGAYLRRNESDGIWRRT